MSPCRWTALAALAAAATATPAAEFDCVTEPSQTVEIRSAVPGIISRVLVRRGDLIKPGQVLVELDDALDRAATEVAAHRAAMVGAQQSAEARVEHAGQRASRLADLAGQNFVSVQDRDSALAERRLAAAAVAEAAENRRLAQLEHKRQVEQARLRSLRSPMTGVVVDRLAHPGELAGSGENAKPILKLADLSVLHVEVILPSSAWSRVRTGQAVEVRAELPAATRQTARVVAVDRVLDAASGSFGVRLELPNPGQRLPAGMRCLADFPELEAPRKAAAGARHSQP
ncbi:MAG: efflux RND transporter periplasmic adaptor subunit [Burkholderiaceae bacterium]|nr:efflux RND transporter periplasmic adaptor subunit [Burkholderiaceae bacterium]